MLQYYTIMLLEQFYLIVGQNNFGHKIPQIFQIGNKKKLTLKEKQTRHLFVGNGHLGNLQKSFLFPVVGDYDFVSCFRFALSFCRPFS